MQNQPYSPRELAQFFDHTILKPDAKRSDIERLCDEAIEFGFKGVCVNPVYMPLVARRLESSKVLPVAVVGFPLGANATSIKVAETHSVIQAGAAEVDMVIHVGAYLDDDMGLVRQDIEAVVRAAGEIPVKVILETGFLQPADIARLSLCSADVGAAFIKTSTGFGPRGASVDDVKTMRAALMQAGHTTKIKASGGIRDLQQMLALVEAGADRIGASASVKILHEL